MNRADKMLRVLKDGRAHSRREIFERVGFMLTNNAAAELRARGFNVEHRKERGNDVYRIVLDEAAGRVPPPAASSSTPPLTRPSPRQAAGALSAQSGRDGADVLSLFGDAT